MRKGILIALVLGSAIVAPDIAAACEPGNVDIDGPTQVPYGKATTVNVFLPIGGTITYAGLDRGQVANPFEDVITTEEADANSEGWFPIRVEVGKTDDPGLLTVSDGVGCATLTITPTRGKPARLTVTKQNPGTVSMNFRGRRSCDTLQATRATVSITWLAARNPTQRLTYDDVCSEPTSRGRRHAYRVDTRVPGELTLRLARLPRRNTARGWTYAVRMNGRLVKRGLIWQSVTVYGRPDRVIWQGTDEFWNVCINEGRNIWSSDGRLYCWDFGWTRAVRRVELQPYFPGD